MTEVLKPLHTDENLSNEEKEGACALYKSLVESSSSVETIEAFSDTYIERRKEISGSPLYPLKPEEISEISGGISKFLKENDPDSFGDLKEEDLKSNVAESLRKHEVYLMLVDASEQMLPSILKETIFELDAPTKERLLSGEVEIQPINIHNPTGITIFTPFNNLQTRPDILEKGVGNLRNLAEQGNDEIKDYFGGNFEDISNEDLIRFLQYGIHTRSLSFVSSGKNPGIVSRRSVDKLTGVLGSEDTEDRLAKSGHLLAELNTFVESVLGPEATSAWQSDSEKLWQDIRVVTTPDRCDCLWTVNSVSKREGASHADLKAMVDFTGSIVQVNNVKGVGLNPSQLLEVSNNSLSDETEQIYEPKGKGTKFYIRTPEDHTYTPSEKENEQELSFEQKQQLFHITNDSFITAKGLLHYFSNESRYDDLLQLIQSELHVSRITLPESSANKAIIGAISKLSSEVTLPETFETKSDVSGYSLLSAELQRHFPGLSVTRFMNPVLSKMHSLNEVFGGLDDNESGDSKDFYVLSPEMLKSFGLESQVPEELRETSAVERSILLGVASDVMFNAHLVKILSTDISAFTADGIPLTEETLQGIVRSYVEKGEVVPDEVYNACVKFLLPTINSRKPVGIKTISAQSKSDSDTSVLLVKHADNIFQWKHSPVLDKSEGPLEERANATPNLHVALSLESPNTESFKIVPPEIAQSLASDESQMSAFSDEGVVNGLRDKVASILIERGVISQEDYEAVKRVNHRPLVTHS
jgi:hypothetical protein